MRYIEIWSERCLKSCKDKAVNKSCQSTYSDKRIHICSTISDKSIETEEIWLPHNEQCVGCKNRKKVVKEISPHFCHHRQVSKLYKNIPSHHSNTDNSNWYNYHETRLHVSKFSKFLILGLSSTSMLSMFIG